MRYIDPEATIRGRLETAAHPQWDAAVMCFRDLEGSRAIVSRFGATPTDQRLLWGAEPSEDRPTTFECRMGGRRVAVLTRCHWGGSQAAILVEELAQLGVGSIVGIGAAGGLVEEFPKGTQTVASSALVTDGTSTHYTTETEAYPNADLLDLARSVAADAGIPTRDACVATVDAVYRETPALIEGYRARGAQIVNMETTPFYAAAARCGVRALWLGHVSDCLSKDAWEPWDDLEDMTAVTADWAARVLERLPS
jgi:uridine phosphorylase